MQSHDGHRLRSAPPAFCGPSWTWLSTAWLTTRPAADRDRAVDRASWTGHRTSLGLLMLTTTTTVAVLVFSAVPAGLLVLTLLLTFRTRTQR